MPRAFAVGTDTILAPIEVQARPCRAGLAEVFAVGGSTPTTGHPEPLVYEGCD